MLAVTVPTALLPRTRAFQSRSVATSSTFGNLPPLGGMLHCLECIETPILPVLAAVPPEGHREEAGMAAKDSIDVRFPLAPARKHNSNNIWYRRWRKTGCPRRNPGVTRPNRGRRSYVKFSTKILRYTDRYECSAVLSRAHALGRSELCAAALTPPRVIRDHGLVRRLPKFRVPLLRPRVVMPAPGGAGIPLRFGGRAGTSRCVGAGA